MDIHIRGSTSLFRQCLYHRADVRADTSYSVDPESLFMVDCGGG